VRWRELNPAAAEIGAASPRGGQARPARRLACRLSALVTRTGTGRLHDSCRQFRKPGWCRVNFPDGTIPAPRGRPPLGCGRGHRLSGMARLTGRPARPYIRATSAAGLAAACVRRLRRRIRRRS